MELIWTSFVDTDRAFCVTPECLKYGTRVKIEVFNGDGERSYWVSNSELPNALALLLAYAWDRQSPDDTFEIRCDRCDELLHPLN